MSFIFPHTYPLSQLVDPISVNTLPGFIHLRLESVSFPLALQSIGEEGGGEASSASGFLPITHYHSVAG